MPSQTHRMNKKGTLDNGNNITEIIHFAIVYQTKIYTSPECITSYVFKTS